MGKLKLMYNGINVLTIKMKQPSVRYQDANGELDIMIDAAKNSLFDDVYLQTECGKMPFPLKMNAVSWHGFYFRKNGEIKAPLLNFKREGIGKQKRIAIPVRHNGTINQNDLFAFPILSLYIPNNLGYRINKDLSFNNNEDEMIKIDKGLRNARVDLFVLPKGITAEDFMSKYVISLNYLLFDITMFDRSKNGEFIPLQAKPKILFASLEDHQVLIRIIYNDYFREYELNNKYGLLIHDPNNTIDMLLNRLFGYEENEKIKMELFREMHNNNVEEVRKKQLK
ncbi:hypothetical protein SAMN05216238_109172 [Lentibacillus persicus]|uniref:Uncharacterized protein n=1 Tax=Lentibacillus persicus TaxID=640948 RepID=A0A1I1YGR9_9BACI|nr:hypothetical protein [Lentibacillus persicus]SFE18721.1 hypothetical protein SAMN05216238_109172 [Lentibacillus persicus]